MLKKDEMKIAVREDQFLRRIVRPKNENGEWNKRVIRSCIICLMVNI